MRIPVPTSRAIRKAHLSFWDVMWALAHIKFVCKQPCLVCGRGLLTLTTSGLPNIGRSGAR